MKETKSPTPSYAHICRYEKLLQAWEKVRAKGAAGGIDRQNLYP